MSSAPRHYTNGRVAKSAAEEACHQGETPRGSRHPRKPQGSRAESGSRWVVEVVEVEVVELLFGPTCNLELGGRECARCAVRAGHL